MTSTGKVFSNSNVDKKFCILNKSLLNVLSNFIPQETLSCNDNNPQGLTEIKTR